MTRPKTRILQALHRNPRNHRVKRQKNQAIFLLLNGYVNLQANPNPSKCLGVFGLSLETTEQDLRAFFSYYGPLTGVTLVLHQRSGRSRGYAFVNFVKIEDSKRAMEQANGMELDGMPIRLDYSITKRAHSPTPGVYKGKQPIEEEDVRGYWRARASYHNRGYDRGHDRGYDRYHDRGYDRYHDRGYDRYHDRYYDRGFDRGYDRRYDRYDRYDDYDRWASRRHSPSPDYGRIRPLLRFSPRR
nr:transformer-2 protein homolog alpha-like [Nerophis lumbriciformis]